MSDLNSACFEILVFGATTLSTSLRSVSCPALVLISAGSHFSTELQALSSLDKYEKEFNVKPFLDAIQCCF